MAQVFNVIEGKSPALVQLIESLDVPKRGWVLLDHWDADTNAIGVAHHLNPRRLIYIALTDMGYYYACEEPKGSEVTEFVTTSEGEIISRAELVKIIEDYLG